MTMNILDLDLEHDLNANVISPMWPEGDSLDAETILVDDFSFFTSSNNEYTWDTVQNIDQFYWDLENTRTCTSDTNTTQNYVQQTAESYIDSWPDLLKDNLLELEIFGECLGDDDISIGSEKESTSKTMTTTSSAHYAVDSIADWNRRRSLLYDKNEFVKSVTDCNNNNNNNNNNERYERRNNPSTASTDQRTYKCSVHNCDKTYYKASHLKSHMRRHSGMKPFACDWDGCKWRFSRSDELTRHKRSHSGIKPYSCNLCDKAFSRSDHLSKHAKVHMKKMALYGTPIITKKCNYKYLTSNKMAIK